MLCVKVWYIFQPVCKLLINVIRWVRKIAKSDY